VKLLFAILTALALVGNQFAVQAIAAPAKACCGKCGGACCVKDSTPPTAGEPLAPAPVSGAPNVELILNASTVLAFVFAEIARPCRFARNRFPLLRDRSSSGFAFT